MNEENSNDEIVMYIVVNSDIKMSKGKTAAQVAHGAVRAASRADKWVGPHDDWVKWLGAYSGFTGSQTKIILKAPEAAMRALNSQYEEETVLILDEGRTEIAPGTPTVLAFIPMKKSKAPSLLANCKLL